MSVYQWLCLLGVPTLIVGMTTFFINQVRKSKKDSDAIRQGIQALLRAQMIADWNRYSEKGYAPIYARENFENCWQHYHGLGVNGVMDGLHDSFMALPLDPPNTSKRRTKNETDN